MPTRAKLESTLGEDYVTHSIAVAMLVEAWAVETGKLEGDELEEVMAAAVLHDVVEDTSVTMEAIELEFGPIVAQYVWFLTDPPSYVGNRATRKAVTVEKLRVAPRNVKIIKHF